MFCNLSAPCSVLSPDSWVQGFHCRGRIDIQRFFLLFYFYFFILSIIAIKVGFINDLRLLGLPLYSYIYPTPWWTVQILGSWTMETFFHELCQISFSTQNWLVFSLTLHLTLGLSLPSCVPSVCSTSNLKYSSQLSQLKFNFGCQKLQNDLKKKIIYSVWYDFLFSISPFFSPYLDRDLTL